LTLSHRDALFLAEEPEHCPLTVVPRLPVPRAALLLIHRP